MTNPSEASFNYIEWPRCMSRLRVMNSFAIFAVAIKTLQLVLWLPTDIRAKQRVAMVLTMTRKDTVPSLSDMPRHPSHCNDELRPPSPRWLRTEGFFRSHRQKKKRDAKVRWVLADSPHGCRVAFVDLSEPLLLLLMLLPAAYFPYLSISIGRKYFLRR